ncbi:hypothetical protein FA95DRAFT_1543543 [Auriscalpium vulgare]|uniref:Uncharacterized protein n=1 Tax=Auriscalpium vulgare TaxID=40419 RepID=A0ACB8RPW8_9AGAM|nr:hypothetical protein FA95DRAFT_1543543 [Auriscalpium vulgare]
MSLQQPDNEDFWAPDPSEGTPPVLPYVPPALERAVLRLQFPPSYVVVGAYRLLTDKSLLVPIWKKCKHGFLRGVAVAAGWAFFSFKIQRKLVELFWINSPSVTGLANDTILGIKVPFDVPTYATIIFLSSQVTAILTFFLARNLRIARERAWDQTVASRGKGPAFWRPYVEEWDVPPVVDEARWAGLAAAQGWVLSFAVKRVLLLPLHVVPVAGTVAVAAMKALDVARFLHRPVRLRCLQSTPRLPHARPYVQYFAAKKMSRPQIAVFIAEHKWDYRAFGFVAALLESIPVAGLLFSVSNRIGAAMWAHDLEKRQHFVAEERAKKGL